MIEPATIYYDDLWTEPLKAICEGSQEDIIRAIEICERKGDQKSKKFMENELGKIAQERKG